MLNEKIVHKVHLLLNKAANNSSREEAQSCILMAQKLMIENGISQSEVDAQEDNVRVKNVIRMKTDYEHLSWWKKGIARVIAENFRCHHYISKMGRSSCIVFLGLDQDVDLAKMTFEFACESIKYGVKQFTKERKSKGFSTQAGFKNDYMDGWIQGLRDRFKQQITESNWGLVLVKDALVIQEYENMKLKKGRASSITVSGSSSARSSGYRDGKNFSSPSGRLNA